MKFQILFQILSGLVVLNSYSAKPVTSSPIREKRSAPGEIKVAFLCDVSCVNTIGGDVTSFLNKAAESSNQAYSGLTVGGAQVSFTFVPQRFSTEINLMNYKCKDGSASCHPLQREAEFLNTKACPFAGTPLEAMVCGGVTGTFQDKYCHDCGSLFVITEDQALDDYGIGGAAYKGSMCKKEKFGVVEPMMDPVMFGARMSHELGHQFGMPDERNSGSSYEVSDLAKLPSELQADCSGDAGCSSGNCVMNGILETSSGGAFPTEFSGCSKAAFNMWASRSDTSCVSS